MEPQTALLTEPKRETADSLRERESARTQDGSLAGRQLQPALPRTGSTLLQSAIGNRATQRLLTSTVLQPKLTIGAPDDAYKKEADAVAEQVVSPQTVVAGSGTGSDDAGSGPAGSGEGGDHRSSVGLTGKQNLAGQMLLRRIPIRTLQQTLGNRALARLLQDAPPAKETVPAPATPHLRRKCACGGAVGDEEGECAECRANRLALQRKATGTDAGSEAPAIVDEVLRTPGQPLADSARKVLEPGFGRDFSQVRVHDDSQAAQSASAVNARAYTVGSHIVFGEGQYAPGTTDGNRLLARELTHTIQQTGCAAVQRQDGTPDGTPDSSPPQSLDERYQSALQQSRQTGNWQATAELLNGFNREDIQSRLAQLGPQEPGYIYQGAVDNPRVGPDSQVAQLTRPGAPQASSPGPAATQPPPAAAPPPQQAAPEPGPPQLVQSFRGWVAEGNWPEAAEVLNGFNTTDIHTLLSGPPPQPPLSADQIASIHQGALDNPRVGPQSQVAQLTASAAPASPSAPDASQPVAQMDKTQKLMAALKSSIRQAPEAFGAQAEALMKPEALLEFAAFTVVFMALQSTPAGWATDLAILGLEAIMIGPLVKDAVGDLVEFYDKATAAQDQATIDQAGQALAAALAILGIAILIELLFHESGEKPETIEGKKPGNRIEPKEKPGEEEPSNEPKDETNTGGAFGTGTLTAGEASELQRLADSYNTEIDVIGSRAAGQGRNINTDLSVGKGPNTRSDIDIRYDGEVDINTGGKFTDQLRAVGNGAGSPASAIGAGHSSPPVIEFRPNTPPVRRAE